MVSAGARGSIDAEGELHSLNGVGSGVLGGLLGTFAFDGSLTNEVGGSVSYKVRCFERLDSTK
jgi:hypothetical protein